VLQFLFDKHQKAAGRFLKGFHANPENVQAKRKSGIDLIIYFFHYNIKERV
jgi:hypothetical protein